MEIASVIFWMMVFVAMAAWTAAEWMVVKEVVRMCRDAELRCLAKVRSVAMAVAEIPFACLFLFVCFFQCTAIPTPNGYCIHLLVEGADFAGIVLWLALAPVFGLAFGLLGLASILAFLATLGKVLFGNCENDMCMDLCVFASFALSGAYSLVWAFMRGKMMRSAPGHSKWRTAFVFWVTYWPQVLLIVLLNVAEGTANARGGECCCLLCR